MFKILVWQIFSGFLSACSVVLWAGMVGAVLGFCENQMQNIQEKPAMKFWPLWMISCAVIVGFTFVGLNWH